MSNRGVPPLGGGDRRGRDEPAARRAWPGRGDRVSQGTSLVLASKSAARRALLAGAGVPFEAASSGIDEDAAKARLLSEGANARAVAEALAEAKAVAVSRR